MAAGRLLGLKEETVAASLASFSCGFGRMEKLPASTMWMCA